MFNQRELVFLPLGGCGEIGMNMSLYGFDGSWLMVDCGVTFGDDLTPGVDVIVPDPHFVRKNAGDLVGIVITHAHEDHLGALPYLWRQFNCPIYLTSFAAGLLRRKLTETGLADAVQIIEISPGERVSLGPFEVSFIPVTHSVPETQALAIKTKLGTILHASDWKMDTEPMVGPKIDETAFKKLGDSKILALMCDSTNIFVDGRAGSEGPLRQSMIEVVAGCKKRVAVAFFASNVARMETCIQAALETKRRVALVGRSLIRISEIAKECGYIRECPDFIDAKDIGYLPRKEVLMLVTGSQGEPKAALSRIAENDHPDISFSEGDAVIFSSREIPGNERSIGRLKNQLARQNVNVIEEGDAFVHVSGHPAREEIKELYEWVRPPLLVPIHGEPRHLIEHCKFAKDSGIPSVSLAENGEILRLAPGQSVVVDKVQSGRYAVDGRRLIPLEGGIVKARRQMNFSGNVLVTIVLDKKCELLKAPQLSAPGLVDDAGQDIDLQEKAISKVIKSIETMSRKQRLEEEKLKRNVSQVIRKVFFRETAKRPMVLVHIVRV